MGAPSRLISKIRKTLADYSLRRYLRYAVQPWHWPLLVEMQRRKAREIALFGEQLASAIDGLANEDVVARHVFRPWLACAPVACLAPAASPPISLPSDPELRMRVDRLGWVLEQAVDSLTQAWGGVDEWLKSRETAPDVCADAYTRSERIANLVMLCSLGDPPLGLSDHVRQLICRDAEALLEQVEYHGELNTNNHVLNNARALLIASVFLGDGRFYRGGRFIFEHQLFRHVDVDGLLREASSHYQLVITRWLLEVSCVFRLQDPTLFERFRPVFEQSLAVCQVMFELGQGQGHMALIGDISPDFPPDFYRGLTALGQRLFAIENPPESGAQPESSFWQKYFGPAACSPACDWLAGNGSWASLNRDGWRLLLHADTEVADPRATHGHHDLFSFDLSCDGLPLIVDPGRRNYALARDAQGAGILEEWHNTVMLDGVRTGFYPRGYMPTAWLESFRPCPSVVRDGDAICVALRDKLPAGVVLIERSFVREPGGGMRVVSSMTVSDAQPRSLRLVLHLAGEVEVGPRGARIAHGGRRFLLDWHNLPEPTAQAVERYVAYEHAEPCRRLEWLVPVESPRWEAVFSIKKEEFLQ
jgi:Heparinase II/III-like protein